MDSTQEEEAASVRAKRPAADDPTAQPTKKQKTPLTAKEQAQLRLLSTVPGLAPSRDQRGRRNAISVDMSAHLSSLVAGELCRQVGSSSVQASEPMATEAGASQAGEPPMATEATASQAGEAMATDAGIHAIDVAAGVQQYDIERYERDGVVLLRGLLGAGEVSALRQTLGRVHAQRSSPFHGAMGSGGGWVDKFLWRSEPTVRALAWHTGLTRAVAALLRSPSLNLLYDHECVKECGDAEPTLWHHDINYLPVEPPGQFASAWVALDDASALSGRLQFVRASHAQTHEDGASVRYTPMDFPTMSAVTDEAWQHPEAPSRRGFQPLPDIEAERGAHDIVAADCAAGDALVFHGLTLHYSAGNRHPTAARRAISLRYTGSGARYTPRNKDITSGWPRPLHELLQPGAPLTCEVFPQVFP